MGLVSLQFSSQPGWLSKAIEWMGKGPYSHVDAILKDGRLLGARLDGGVAIRPAGYATFNRILRVDVPCTDEQEGKFYEFLFKQIGKPYDKAGIVAVILGRDWHDDSAWFCSEYIAAGLENSKIFSYFLVLPTDKVDPDGLLLALSVLVKITIPQEGATS